MLRGISAEFGVFTPQISAVLSIFPNIYITLSPIFIISVPTKGFLCYWQCVNVIFKISRGISAEFGAFTPQVSAVLNILPNICITLSPTFIILVPINMVLWYFSWIWRFYSNFLRFLSINVFLNFYIILALKQQNFTQW